VDSTAEEHLRIGALEDAGDAGAPLELLLDDRPDGLMSSLGILDLLLPAQMRRPAKPRQLVHNQTVTHSLPATNAPIPP